MPHRVLLHAFVEPKTKEHFADTAAAASAALAGVSWLGALNDVLTAVATMVAIIAGLYSIKWHQTRIKKMREELREVHQQVVPQEPEEENQDESIGEGPRSTP